MFSRFPAAAGKFAYYSLLELRIPKFTSKLTGLVVSRYENRWKEAMVLTGFIKSLAPIRWILRDTQLVR